MTKQVWDKLESLLLRLYQMDEEINSWFNSDIYMSCYTLVYEYCVGKSESADSATVSENILGGELYHALSNFYERHLPTLQSTLLSSSNGVSEYVRHWQRYYEAALRVESMFQYVDRHWVLRERFDGKMLLPIVGLLWMRWDEAVLRGAVEERLFAFIEGALRTERMTESCGGVHNGMVTDIIQSYRELSRLPGGSLVAGGDVGELKRNGIKEDIFALRLLPWYFARLQEDSVARLDALEARPCEPLALVPIISRYMRGEWRRCQMYLGRDNVDKWRLLMNDTLKRALYGRVLPMLSRQVEQLLAMEEDPREKLKLVFDLATLFREKHRDLASIVAQSFAARLRSRLPRLAVTSLRTEQMLMFIALLFAMFKEGRRMVEHAMGNNPLMREAFDEGLHLYLRGEDSSNGSFYPILGEALARYLDRVIRDQEDITDDLIDLMRTLLRCLDQKSQFQKAHARLLARRLLARQLFQQDREELLLAPLAASYGPVFIASHRRMLEDVEQSRQMTRRFLAVRKSALPSFDLSFQILTSGSWPAELTDEDESCKNIKWDVQLTTFLEPFSQFYQSEHACRIMVWSPSLTAAEVSVVFGGRQYSLVMSAVQYAIVSALSARGRPALTGAEMAEATGLSSPALESAIRRLEHFGLVVSSSSVPTQYAINASFSSPHSRLNVMNRPNVDEQPLAASLSPSSEMNEDRSVRTQAALVRHLKEKQSCPRSDPALLATAGGCELTLETALKTLVEKEYVAIDPHTEVITYLP